MLVDDAIKLMERCAQRMDAMYGAVVFDEWALMSVEDEKARVLSYRGPRKHDFTRHLNSDLGELRPKLLAHAFDSGDFEFARYAKGTNIEAFMVAGEGVYILCNNTRESMEGIARDARWLNAQVPFVELAETFRKNPVIDWSWSLAK